MEIRKKKQKSIRYEDNPGPTEGRLELFFSRIESGLYCYYKGNTAYVRNSKKYIKRYKGKVKMISKSHYLNYNYY